MPGPVRPDDGIEIVYQGYACSPPCAYVRRLGLAPDFGFVHIARDEFSDFTIETAEGEAAERDPEVRGLATRERGAPPRDAAPPGRGFRSKGDLTITERHADDAGGGGQDVASVTFRDVLVAVDAVQSDLDLDDDARGDDIVRVNITDIRYLWRERGYINIWVNVTPRGALRGRDSAPAEAPASPQASQERSAEVTQGDLLPGSLNQGVAPWTLRELLE